MRDKIKLSIFKEVKLKSHNALNFFALTSKSIYLIPNDTITSVSGDPMRLISKFTSINTKDKVKIPMLKNRYLKITDRSVKHEVRHP